MEWQKQSDWNNRERDQLTEEETPGVGKKESQIN